MSVNLASKEFVRVVDCSSSISGCSADNVLVGDTSIWLSEEGLPQWLYFAFDKRLAEQNSIIKTIGWHVWHRYTTNPRQVKIHVSQDGSQFKTWNTIIATHLSGTQLFSCSPINIALFPFIAMEITHTFGGNQTYMNRLFFYSDELTSTPYSSVDISKNYDNISKEVSVNENDIRMQEEEYSISNRSIDSRKGVLRDSFDLRDDDVIDTTPKTSSNKYLSTSLTYGDRHVESSSLSSKDEFIFNDVTHTRDSSNVSIASNFALVIDKQNLSKDSVDPLLSFGERSKRSVHVSTSTSDLEQPSRKDAESSTDNRHDNVSGATLHHTPEELCIDLKDSENSTIEMSTVIQKHDTIYDGTLSSSRHEGNESPLVNQLTEALKSLENIAESIKLKYMEEKANKNKNVEKVESLDSRHLSTKNESNSDSSVPIERHLNNHKPRNARRERVSSKFDNSENRKRITRKRHFSTDTITNAPVSKTDDFCEKISSDNEKSLVRKSKTTIKQILQLQAKQLIDYFENDSYRENSLLSDEMISLSYLLYKKYYQHAKLLKQYSESCK